MEIEVKYKIPPELERQIINFMQPNDTLDFLIDGKYFILARLYDDSYALHYSNKILAQHINSDGMKVIIELIEMELNETT